MVSSPASAAEATITTPGLARLRLPSAAGAPSWLVARRRAAARWIDHHGFPTRRDEDWRYLDLSSLLALPFEQDDAFEADDALGRDDAFGPHDALEAGGAFEADGALEAAAASEENDEGVGTGGLAGLTSALGVDHGGVDLAGRRLVFVNGRLVRRLGCPPGGPDELTATSVVDALAERPDEMEAHAAAGGAGWYHAFDALNAALATDGAFIRIPAGAHPETPIQLVFLSLPGGAPRLDNPRSMILAEAGSRVSLMVHNLGPFGEPVCTNAVTTVVCAEGAEVDYTEIQDAPESAHHLSLLDVRQAADSRFSARTVSIGGLVARHEVRVALAGRGAEATLDGLYLPAGRQYHDHPVLVDHVAPGAISRQLYKGVVTGSGHGVFNGRIVVRPGAAGTDAAQTNKNLLLSDRAEVDTRPRLEIHADDVRCAHGAAVGQLDPDALYYLRSRGIPRADAERIMVAGFAEELTGRIPHESVRTYVQLRMAERLSGREDA